MSRIIDFQKSIQGLNENDLNARVKEDELRLKSLNLRIHFLRWKIQ